MVRIRGFYPLAVFKLETVMQDQSSLVKDPEHRASVQSPSSSVEQDMEMTHSHSVMRGRGCPGPLRCRQRTAEKGRQQNYSFAFWNVRKNAVV